LQLTLETKEGTADARVMIDHNHTVTPGVRSSSCYLYGATIGWGRVC